MTSQSSAPGARVAVIVNPRHARRAHRAAAVLRAECERLRLRLVGIHETTPDSPGADQARAALADGADIVVAVGGDGTVREVAGAVAGTGARLGVVPTGTANLYARNVGLPLDLDRAVRVALVGAPRDADLGRVTLTTSSGLRESSFLVVLGVGHDALTLQDVPGHHASRLGWLGYVLPGLRHLTRPGVPMRVALDGGPAREWQPWTLLVANCGRLPAGLRVVPGAHPDDGRFHVLEVAPAGVRDWVGIAASGLFPREEAPAGLRRHTASRVAVELPSPVAVQLDGDVIEDVTALEVQIRPGALVVHARPTARALPDVALLSDEAVAALVHDVHDGGVSDDEQDVVVGLLTRLTGERFQRVKYLLNSQGDQHDLEQLVFDRLDDAHRGVLLDHIVAQADATGPSRDVRVLCDIDDTVKCAIHDDRYLRGTIYPGIVEFLHALDEGSTADPGRPGDLTFVTARPAGPRGLVERYTRNALGDLGLPPHTVMGGSFLNLHTKAAIAERKRENFHRDRLLFPECRMVFCGDSGQADPQVGLDARRRYGDHVVAVFIHDVVGVDADTRRAWADEGVFAVDTWDEAARLARRLDLVSAEGLAEVERAVARDIRPQYPADRGRRA